MGYHYDMVTIGYDDDVFYDVCSVTQMSTISSCKRRLVGLFVMLFPHFLETLRKPLNVPQPLVKGPAIPSRPDANKA